MRSVQKICSPKVSEVTHAGQPIYVAVCMFAGQFKHSTLALVTRLCLESDRVPYWSILALYANRKRILRRDHSSASLCLSACQHQQRSGSSGTCNATTEQRPAAAPQKTARRLASGDCNWRIGALSGYAAAVCIQFFKCKDSSKGLHCFADVLHTAKPLKLCCLYFECCLTYVP